jgi:hypothetical protein
MNKDSKLGMLLAKINAAATDPPSPGAEIINLTDELSQSLTGGLNAGCGEELPGQNTGCANSGCHNSSCSAASNHNNLNCTNVSCTTVGMQNSSCTNRDCQN